jgi:ketosteroid isomerase-like protein
VTAVPASAAARAWLDRFAERVRARDLEGGRAMFAPDCISFGTRAERAADLDELVARQWAPIWTTTSGFAFDDDAEELAGGDQLVVLTRWRLTGDGPEGPFPRRGRATIVLVPGEDGLDAVHTHFSVTPEP